jgi:hypothetical protein
MVRGVGVGVGVLGASGVGVLVAVAEADEPANVRLSKFVSQPLELLNVMLEHAPVQLVLIVLSWAGAKLTWTVTWPGQLRLIVVVVVPPLSASSWISRIGVGRVTDALRKLVPLNEILFVENCA